jgi:hypothetical protein
MKRKKKTTLLRPYSPSVGGTHGCAPSSSPFLFSPEIYRLLTVFLIICGSSYHPCQGQYKSRLFLRHLESSHHPSSSLALSLYSNRSIQCHVKVAAQRYKKGGHVPPYSLHFSGSRNGPHTTHPRIRTHAHTRT